LDFNASENKQIQAAAIDTALQNDFSENFCSFRLNSDAHEIFESQESHIWMYSKQIEKDCLAKMSQAMTGIQVNDSAS